MSEIPKINNEDSPEDRFIKFEKFFVGSNRINVCLEQIASREEIESPQFIFHTTSKRSVEKRKTGVADEKWFSFSKDAWHSLRYLDHRFLQRLRYVTTGVDSASYEPVFLIADYEKLKVNPNFKERHGREGHELEIQMPFADLGPTTISIESFQELQNFADFLKQNSSDSENKVKAMEALQWNLDDWQEIEKLREEKTS